MGPLRIGRRTHKKVSRCNLPFLSWVPRRPRRARPLWAGSVSGARPPGGVGGFEIIESMNPARKRKVRLVVALERSRGARQRADLHELQRREPGADAEPACCTRRSRAAATSLTGTVAAGSRAPRTARCSTSRRATARAGRRSRSPTPAPCPDPFREGREVIVTVEKQGGRYVGERNSLITKCPSKYKTAPAGEKQSS